MGPGGIHHDAELGREMKLPPRYAPHGERIEGRLTPLRRPAHAPAAAASATGGR